VVLKILKERAHVLGIGGSETVDDVADWSTLNTVRAILSGKMRWEWK
jgi:hypothetical protein